MTRYDSDPDFFSMAILFIVILFVLVIAWLVPIIETGRPFEILWRAWPL